MGIPITVCSLRNPREPWRWQHLLVAALREAGADVTTVSSQIPVLPRALLSAATIPLYGRTDRSRMPLMRRARATKAARQIGTGRSGDILHLGTAALPLPELRAGDRHYLFTDSTWDNWLEFDPLKSRYSRRYLTTVEALERASYGQMNHIFCTAHYVKESFAGHYGIPPDRISVTGTGLGPIHPYFGPKEYSPPRLLFVAKERFAEKGGELAVEAFERARRVRPALRLTIAGGADGGRFRGREHIETVGFTSSAALQSLFESHSLFVMPSINEPWGMVYLEAMACRMPILGLRRKSFPEISEDGKFGFLADSPEPDAVAAALLEAVGDSERLAAMGKAAQEAALQKHTWKRTAELIVQGVAATKSREL